MGSFAFVRYRLRPVIWAAAIAVATAGSLYLVHNPAVSVVGMEATVEGISPNQNKVGTSSSYSYSLRLEDGRTVFASDYLFRPHLKGARVTIERVTYKSGRISYRFPNFLGIAGSV
jgi:hypothetical protein